MKTSKSQVAAVTGPDIQPDAMRKVEDDATSIREPYTAANVKMLPEGFDDDSCDDIDIEVIENALDNEGCRDEPLLWKDLPEEVTIITARGGQEGSPEARFEFCRHLTALAGGGCLADSAQRLTLSQCSVLSSGLRYFMCQLQMTALKEKKEIECPLRVHSHAFERAGSRP